MNETNIVALLDKPSTESFGMVPLITKKEDNDFYEVFGLAPREIISVSNLISVSDYDRLYGGHVLKVLSSVLPEDLSNPVALWIGHKFSSNAVRHNAPPLPDRGTEGWYPSLDLKEGLGEYSAREASEAYKILDDWVKATGVEALIRDSYDLASLMSWTLPTSPETEAVMYLTNPTEEGKARELAWQLRMRKSNGNPTTPYELIQEHEKIGFQLLEQAE